ncbi:MAG TPA: hypothetical protein VGV39_22665 [Mesorhizobium sp.]|uniref:hypothetical protein n=1 Tax=Mesorhizobium sp. TaxID=1871066 RepID=UPI002DDCBA74|nr:hypothetical protein [Mesorhizobium sp.]HEV2505900.1 hypothetical protein [Mesorhizobium sp.]
MLEELAYRFISQDESSLNATAYGLVLIGAIIAAFTVRSKSEIARAPYFAYSMLIFLLASAVQIVWLQSLHAMAGGYLWVLMLVSIAASIISGFFLCGIAKARSRDAYGHARLAALAFIPLANFWLLLAPSKNAVSANRTPTIPILTGIAGVLTGFILLVGGILMIGFVNIQQRKLEQQVQTDPMAQQAGIAFLIHSNSLEGTLKSLAEQAQTPFTVDEVTTLSRIEADGTQLHRTFVVDREGWTMTDDFRQGNRSHVCASQPFTPLFRAGASIHEIYVGRDGREIGTVVVTPQDCGL